MCRNKKNICVYILVLFFVGAGIIPSEAQDVNIEPLDHLEIQISDFNFMHHDKDLVVSDIYAIMNWNTMILKTTMYVTWDKNEYLYLMPSKSFSLLKDIYPLCISIPLNNILATAQQTIQLLAHELNLEFDILNQIVANSYLVSNKSLSNLFGIGVTYHTNLLPLLQDTMLPQYSVVSPSQTLNAMEIPRLQYTSIVFAVDQSIPLVSDATVMVTYIPRMLPIVLSPKGELVYSTKYFDRNNTDGLQSPYRYFYTDSYYEMPLGITPLIVIPQAVNSKNGGDIIISQKDADMILGNDILSSFLTSGKVFFILSDKQKSVTHVINTSADRVVDLVEGVEW